MYSMANLFFVKTQEKNIYSISREAVQSAFRERIDLKVPVSAFFHFGLNACIENENNENQWFEQMFHFYSMIENDSKLLEQGKFFRVDAYFEGMELEGFITFCKDARSRFDEHKLRELYEATCEQNQH